MTAFISVPIRATSAKPSARIAFGFIDVVVNCATGRANTASIRARR
jgi:hypothetical protein